MEVPDWMRNLPKEKPHLKRLKRDKRKAAEAAVGGGQKGKKGRKKRKVEQALSHKETFTAGHAN